MLGLRYLLHRTSVELGLKPGLRQGLENRGTCDVFISVFRGGTVVSRPRAAILLFPREGGLSSMCVLTYFDLWKAPVPVETGLLPGTSCLNLSEVLEFKPLGKVEARKSDLSNASLFENSLFVFLW